MVNGNATTLKVWDKAGTAITGNVALDSLGGTGTCTSGWGDPIVWIGALSIPVVGVGFASGWKSAVGLGLASVSGDAEAAVQTVAARLEISEFAARSSPEQKLEWQQIRRAAGRRIAMVGDGINDAPVLAAADVSIALGNGSAMALRAADLVLTSPRLGRIADAVTLARRTRRVIRQNLGWALAYNLIAIPIAATGMVAPWLAALGMASSSAVVTMNALRLASSRESGIWNRKSSGADVATAARFAAAADSRSPVLT
jgi:hypothetical protein